MDWTALVTELGTFGISAALVAGILAYLSRSVLGHWFSKAAWAFQADLKARYDREIEQFRSQLQLSTIEHEVRFRSIHEQQARVLARTYARLYEFHKAVASYISVFGHSGEPTKEEQLRIVTDAHEKFVKSFYPCKIFFPKKSGQQVEAVSDKFVEIVNKFSLGQRLEKAGHRPEPTKEHYWLSALDVLKEEIPPLLDRLEDDFQGVLGVPSS